MTPDQVLQIALAAGANNASQILDALEAAGLRIVAADPQKAGMINAVEIITEILKRRGIARRTLCAAINTKESTLTRLFTGKTNSLNLATLNKIIAWDKSQGEAK